MTTLEIAARATKSLDIKSHIGHTRGMSKKAEINKAVKDAAKKMGADPSRPVVTGKARLLNMQEIISNALRSLGPHSDGTSELSRVWKLLFQIYTAGNRNAERNLIAVRLREFREANRLSQGQLAKEIGVDRRQIIRWEKGDVTPHNEYRKKMEELRIV